MLEKNGVLESKNTGNGISDISKNSKKGRSVPYLLVEISLAIYILE